MYGEERVEKEVPVNTRISVLKSMISRSFRGIPIRRRRLLVEDDGGGEIEIGEGDGGRDLGWFIEGRRGVVKIV